MLVQKRACTYHQLNLPIVPITDLTIKENNLIVATQGRSLWILDDLTVLHQLNANLKTKSHILYQPKDSYRMRGSSIKDSKTEGTNHPTGVMTHFYLKNFNQEKDSITLTYFNANNDTLISFNNKVKEEKYKLKDLKKGGNMFAWNMRGKGVEKLKGMILWWANLDGPKAVPGDYKVSLNVNGKEVSKQSFKILADPRAEATPEQMQAQYDFITSVNQSVDKAHQSIKKIRKINAQLEEFSTQYKDDEKTKDLVTKAKDLQEQFGTIEKALYQTKNRSGQDPLNFPIKLTNKLGHLNSLVGMGDFAPTAQDIEVKNQLTQKIDKQLQTFDKLITEEIT